MRWRVQLMALNINDASFKKIKKLSLTAGDDSIPLVTMSCAWSLDSGTFCNVVPVVGQKLLPSAGTNAQIDSFIEGLGDSPVQVILEYDESGDTVVHTGFPITTHVETSSGAVMNTSILARSIGINSRLDLLSAMAPAVRVFFSKSVGPSDNAAEKAKLALTEKSDGSLTSYFTADQTVYQVNPADYIIKLLAKLQKSHRSVADGALSPTETVDEILSTSTTYKLTTAIVHGDRSIVGNNMRTQTAYRARTWVNASSYAALIDFNGMTFNHIVPDSIADSTFKVGPILPLGKAFVKEIKLEDVLSVTRDNDYAEDMMPITQVWVPKIIGGSNDGSITADVAVTQKHDPYNYHRYPTEETKGNALIKQPPTFFNSICQQQLANGGTGNTKGNVVAPGVVSDGTETQVESAKTTAEKEAENSSGDTQEQINTLGTRFAEMYYVERAFNNQTANVSIPWHQYAAYVAIIGQNVKFSIPFEQGSFIGNLVSVHLTIDRPSVRATCNLAFTHVRTTVENEALGFKKHPLYADWIGNTGK